MIRSAWIAVIVAGILLMSCSPTAQSPAQPSSAGSRQLAPAEPLRIAVVALRLEPATLALRPPRETFSNSDHTRLFNADIAIPDDQALPRPYLVEALPRLNTDTWQVFPDGRMRTMYPLRPNLAWHDGTPLSAEDFVFSWRVYANPDVGLSRQPPFDAIDQVEAPDPRTLVIHWKRPYPDAPHMSGRDRNLPALPRHVLEAQFPGDSLESFLTLPYWSRDYVGLGPFRTLNWEPGSFIEAAAFDAHPTGRPKIDRLKLLFIPDQNTALASMLGGELHLAAATTLGIQQSLTLQREWSASGGRPSGTVTYQVFVWRGVNFQFRPALVTPRTLLDVRVRRAMAYALDRPAVNEAITSGLGIEADYLLPPNGQWGAAVQRGAVKYGYDPRISEQLMREAGFAKGPDGIFISPAEGRFSVDVQTGGGGTGPIELAALASDWQKAGFEINQRVIPAALSLDVETRAGFPGMEVTTQPATERTALAPVPGNVPNPENRWRGGSQMSWTNPAYTELVGLFTSTLDREQRADQLAQMARIFSDEVAVISLNFPPLVWAAVSALSGPKAGLPETNFFWNVHEWELR